MAPAAKWRKTTAGVRHASVTPAFQQSIQDFGKISKSQPTRTVKNEPVCPKPAAEPKNGEPHNASDNGNKRKYIVTPEPALENACLTLPKALFSKNVQATLADPLQPSQRLYCSKLHRSRSIRKTVVSSLKVTDTPNNGVRSCLKSFAISSPSPMCSVSSPSSPTQDTPPTSPISAVSPCSTLHDTVPLPESLLDLISLHAAFLSALSLYYVHNGMLSPANVQSLKPSIERLWGKRVSTDDLRKVIALSERDSGRLDSGDSGNSRIHGSFLSLSDYGGGRVCVEIMSEHSRQGIHRRPTDEETLNAKFAETLSQLWETQDKLRAPVLSPSAFLASLPLTPIVPCPSLSSISPLIAKGKHRLSYLKAVPITPEKPNDSVSTKTSTPIAPISRSSSLLSRIKAKQLHQSTLPCAPSRDDLARKSALQRLEEVIPVLEILTSSGCRKLNQSSPDNTYGASPVKEHHTHSMTMPTLVQHLQTSLRNPISKDEAMRCVRFLADDIAPEWVGMREVGKCIGIMIRPGKVVGREEMMRRIGGMLGEM